MGTSPPWLSKFLFRKIVVLSSVCWLLFFMTLTVEVEGRATLVALSTHQPMEEKVTGQGKFVPHSPSDLNYMSKRKVPNGPDPFHNRRQPPGQAEAAQP